MFGIENYTSFVIAILLFQLIPGAGTIAILNATARNGISAGIGAVLGTLLGDFIFMIAALAGLATLLQQNFFFFEILQYLGSAYLCWLGINLLRSKIIQHSASEPRQSGWIYFRQACAVSLTNPKVMLFFVAFFPLFLTSDATYITLVAMILHVSMLSFIYQIGLVFLGNSVAKKMKTFPSARQWAIRLSGLALIGFGLKLAFNSK